MKRRRLLLVLGPPTAVFCIAILVAPGHAALIVHVYLVVVAAGVLGGLAHSLARSLRPSGPSLFELGLLRVPRHPERVAQLERLEREVTLARQNGWDLHTRLRPTLHAIAAGLLAARSGIDLDRNPDRAAARLGPDAWALVDPAIPPPEDRHGPGVDGDTLDRALTSLEHL